MSFKLTNTVGVLGENMALKLYQHRGYSLVGRNVCNAKGKRYGEIDFIVRKKKLLVFVEVKTRTSTRFGNAAESIHQQKLTRLLKAVQWFLNAYPQWQQFQPRIDVCLLELHKVDNSLKNVIILPNAVELKHG